MEEKRLRELKIDGEFKALICPLSKREYRQLEKNLLADGCRDPLITWKGTIVDGHNRYELCTRHNIPFSVVEKHFSCRAEAIAWICANQLGRRNISEETRKFLIGKQYESAKIASRIKNPQGYNQYAVSDDEEEIGPPVHARHKTAAIIAEENHVSRGTVEKYAIYSRALDTLAEKEPSIVPKILSGQYKISHKNVVELSKLSPSDIRIVESKIDKRLGPYAKFHEVRDALTASAEGEPMTKPAQSVKDMPAFDPDADINVLTLTIPSWSSSINRVRTKTDLSIISAGAREGLIKELHSLIKRAEEMLAVIEEA